MSPPSRQWSRPRAESPPSTLLLADVARQEILFALVYRCGGPVPSRADGNIVLVRNSRFWSDAG
jgi:hypothetical protein